MREEIVDGRAYGREELCPFQAPRLGQMGSPPPDGPGEGLRVDEGDIREMPTQHVKLAPAASNNECKRATDAISERAELADVPVNSFTPTAAGCELERKEFNLRAVGDELSPPGVVMLGAAVHMQGGWKTCPRHLRPGQQDALHGMKIVGARHIRQHAVVRRRHERDPERPQGGEDGGAIFELPPALDRRVLVDAAYNDRRALRDQEPR
ncbi:MAG: hypothetical protein HC869_12660 [Rhodospirillales bacterium]|nr:hypothetical protein [Rhodospirillales bacterium]